MNRIIESILIAQIVWIVVSLILCVILSYIYEFKFFIAWYDFWEGIYYDRHKRIIYIILFPCVVFSFDRNIRKGKKKDETKVKPEKEKIIEQVPKY